MQNKESQASRVSPVLQPRFSPGQTSFAAAVLLAAGILAYSNCFEGKFIFDDVIFVEDLQSRTPKEFLLTPESLGRPVISLSLALNYTLGGISVYGYHLFNLAVHILAALTLFGLVRRTLKLDILHERFGATASQLALAVSLLWLVHPLQTESVTYIWQRCESLAGLFYLLTIYCVLRDAEFDPQPSESSQHNPVMRSSRRQKRWYILAAMTCALGMACKATLVTAPVVVFAYDRIFLAKSARLALRRRWGLYIGLAAAWLVMAIIILIAPANTVVNLTDAPFGPVEYARTQSGIVLHYLCLCFWPIGLCLDYQWPIAYQLGEVLPGVLVLGALAGATIWAWFRRPAWSFAGIWFFGILAPTSSFAPLLQDLAFEHRMYLPLAAVAAVAVIGVHLLGAALLRRLSSSFPSWQKVNKHAAAVLLAAATVLLGYLTYQRNEIYHDPFAMWCDVLSTRPGNWRAQVGAGFELIMRGKYAEAINYFNRAQELNSQYPNAYLNRGLAFFRKGDYENSLADYDKALGLLPRNANVYANRGIVRVGKGDYDGALADYDKALELDPQNALCYVNRGVARRKKGDSDGALADFNKAVDLNPLCAEAYGNRGSVRAGKGDYDGASADYDKAVELGSINFNAYFSRGEKRQLKGDSEGALADYGKALELGLKNPMVYVNRSEIFLEKHSYDEAFTDCTKALDLDPRCAEAYGNRGNARLGKGDNDGALEDCNRALELNPQYAPAYYNRGNARYKKGDCDGAISDYTKALEFNSRYINAYSNRAVALYQKGDYSAALADCTLAAALDPSNWKVWMNKGLLLVKIGRDAEAQACFDEGLKINPDLGASLGGMIAQARAEHQALQEKKN